VESVIEILKTFGRLGLEIIPYFLAGTLAGAALKSWLPFSIVERHLGPGPRSMVAASVFGGIVPVCSCSMVPVARAMKDGGAALGTVVAFLLVAPVLSPVTVFLTWGWLGPKFTVARILAAFVGAFLAGGLMERISKYPAQAATPANAGKTGETAAEPRMDAEGSGAANEGRDGEAGACGCGIGPEHADVPSTALSKLRPLWHNSVIILKDLWLYLLLGIAASAIVSVLVPKDLLPSLVGTGVGAYLLAAAVGVPIYVCSGEEIPIAKALLSINLPAGATFSFLLSSTGICLPTILMASKFLGRKNAAVYAFFWLVFSVCAGLVFSLAG